MTGGAAERTVATDWPTRVLNFWFAELTPQDWFVSSDTVDAAIGMRFGDVIAWVAAAPIDALETTDEATRAAIIVLDQFPRNIYRARPEAFATDDKALALADRFVGLGRDAGLSVDERLFVYLPFEHSERLSDQDRSVALFEALGDKTYLDFARKHRDVISRFGRFPHRNSVLGRISTPEEVAFLESEGRGF